MRADLDFLTELPHINCVQTVYTLDDAVFQKPLADRANVLFSPVTGRLEPERQQCHVLPKPLLVVLGLRGDFSGNY